jgi:hypothetical protein
VWHPATPQAIRKLPQHRDALDYEAVRMAHQVDSWSPEYFERLVIRVLEVSKLVLDYETVNLAHLVDSWIS